MLSNLLTSSQGIKGDLGLQSYFSASPLSTPTTPGATKGPTTTDVSASNWTVAVSPANCVSLASNFNSNARYFDSIAMFFASKAHVFDSRAWYFVSNACSLSIATAGSEACDTETGDVAGAKAAKEAVGTGACAVNCAGTGWIATGVAVSSTGKTALAAAADSGAEKGEDDKTGPGTAVEL